MNASGERAEGRLSGLRVGRTELLEIVCRPALGQRPTAPLFIKVSSTTTKNLGLHQVLAILIQRKDLPRRCRFLQGQERFAGPSARPPPASPTIF